MAAKRIWQGPKSLTRRLIPIEDLIPFDPNPRIGDVGEIAESLKAHGQYRSITYNAREGVRTSQMVLTGNHTMKAAAALGWTHIAADANDVSDLQAEQIVLTDNRTNDLATYDDQLLEDMLRNVHQASGDLIGTGFDGDDLEEIIERNREALDLANLPDNRGKLLDLLEVTIEDPKHLPAPGDVYQLDQHLLIVADVFTGHGQWGYYLNTYDLFLPFPGPLVVLGAAAKKGSLLMVQPDPYIAGHILQHWSDAGHKWIEGAP